MPKKTPSKKPAAKKAKATAKKPSPPEPKNERRQFPIIGLGASAGGLEALKNFFSAVKEKSGLAYVVVVHMTPKQPSLMAELLQKVAAIPVTTATDGDTIVPDHAYVIPPDKELTIFDGQIQLMSLVKKSSGLPIDLFLRSLAQDQGPFAAALILSGTGTDGTLGVKEIKAKEGLVMVQREESAGYDGMPRSAINTGLVDIVLPPEEMPARLEQFFIHHKVAMKTRAIPPVTEGQQEWLKKIFTILRAQTGHDFSAYKVNTILRRIGRRMGLNQIDDHSKYVRYLREQPAEVDALFRELLIGVTNFFRDAESFEVLKNKILPGILAGLREDSTFRAWVPGCSTGEEVYSLAMVLRECLDRLPKQIHLQLFGTDIDRHAIDRAREGLFPASIAADVSAGRLKRFFIKEGDFYRIRKEIRDHAVFSVQDVIKDPPFSRLNLLCCRNLLIYLDTAAQKRLLPLFHYTLNPDGVLVLGSSETIGGFSSLFATLDKKWKIFRRREVPKAMRQMVDFPSGTTTADPGQAPSAMAPAQKSDISSLAQQAILKQFASTAILVDSKGEILHIQGSTGKYLEAPSGPPTLNILDMAREGLRIELSSALRAAKNANSTVVRKKISVKTNGDIQLIDLTVTPQKFPKELAGHLLVVFEDIDPLAQANKEADAGADESTVELSKISELERELQSTRESHQTTIEELESSNEELKSTNEELQSANEELQSTNEELESSKEELQSLNEELQTVNAELQSKVEELSAAHDDMHNLLNSTEIATIFVDNDLRIRRFTPPATTIVNLIQTDIGRPLSHVVTNLAYGEMINDLTEVLRRLAPREVEVQTKAGRWFNMRVMPYRTTDNRIDGAVLTFLDIEDQKKAQEVLKNAIQEIEQAWEVTRAVFDMNPDPMLVIDKDGRMIIANQAFYGFMDVDAKAITGSIFDVKAPLLRQLHQSFDLEGAITANKDFESAALTFKTPKGEVPVNVRGFAIKTERAAAPRMVLHMIRME